MVVGNGDHENVWLDPHGSPDPPGKTALSVRAVNGSWEMELTGEDLVPGPGQVSFMTLGPAGLIECQRPGEAPWRVRADPERTMLRPGRDAASRAVLCE